MTDDGALGRAIAAGAGLPVGHVSDDPGRPDYTIDGAPGAMLIIISGPSGVGKDTIIDELRRQERASGREDDRHYVVTVTTRDPRPGEVDGVDYLFVSRDEFLRIREARGFLEANEVHGNWYGTLTSTCMESPVARQFPAMVIVAAVVSIAALRNLTLMTCFTDAMPSVESAEARAVSCTTATRAPSRAASTTTC